MAVGAGKRMSFCPGGTQAFGLRFLWSQLTSSGAGARHAHVGLRRRQPAGLAAARMPGTALLGLLSPTSAHDKGQQTAPSSQFLRQNPWSDCSLSPSPRLYHSLSLSHTHTHTQIHNSPANPIGSFKKHLQSPTISHPLLWHPGLSQHHLLPG